MLRLLATLALISSPAMAAELCRAEVNSTVLTIDRDALPLEPARPGLTERLTAWPSGSLNRLIGRPPACDSETLIAFLSQEVAADQIAVYCLLPDEKLGFILVPGERTYRGRCATTTCDKVNAAKDGALSVAGTAADIATRRDVEGGETRTTAILHASGAAILSGSAASVATSLGTTAANVTAALAAPAVAGAAAVSVVAVGGAVWLCRDGDAAADVSSTD
ncbi:hypothetical protein OCGS_0867 [Oceaniovalibus guishaninsula JLT2003]|uniref:Uncharacterized protein n=1 Tax=Oceaniovalibus guishaninsula JLT2003 TaxID=1231392 RepID=K2HFD2_9RHOB|nr:hypothetical protein [Oceaniovalibus guishaninsula]EKE45172.1 hypothetical protein OCGS_0867 [Oceaniovalibus guishaninsula JLT2003]